MEQHDQRRIRRRRRVEPVEQPRSRRRRSRRARAAAHVRAARRKYGQIVCACAAGEPRGRAIGGRDAVGARRVTPSALVQALDDRLQHLRRARSACRRLRPASTARRSVDVRSTMSRDRLLVVVPALAVAPVVRRDLEVLERRLLARVEARELLGLADLQPELADDRAAFGQLLLELVDLVVGALPVGDAAEAFDALDQHAAVPGAVEDRDAAAAAARGARSATATDSARSSSVGRGDRHVDVLARVERAGDAADRAALAGGVGAFEHEDQRVLAEALAPRVPGERAAATSAARSSYSPRDSVCARSIERSAPVRVVDVRSAARALARAPSARACAARQRRTLQRRQHQLADRQLAILRVGAVDDVPGRRRRRRLAQHVFPHRRAVRKYAAMCFVGLSSGSSRQRSSRSAAMRCFARPFATGGSRPSAAARCRRRASSRGRGCRRASCSKRAACAARLQPERVARTRHW